VILRGFLTAGWITRVGDFWRAMSLGNVGDARSSRHQTENLVMSAIAKRTPRAGLLKVDSARGIWVTRAASVGLRFEEWSETR
jgi:hypothetical protein